MSPSSPKGQTSTWSPPNVHTSTHHHHLLEGKIHQRVGPLTTFGFPSARRPSAARPVEAPTARFDSRGCQVDAGLRPHAEGASPFSSTSLLQRSPNSSGCPEGQDARTRSDTWGPSPPAAAGGRSGSIVRLPEVHAAPLSPPRHRSPGVPCLRRRSMLLEALAGRLPGGRCPMWQLEEELDGVAQ